MNGTSEEVIKDLVRDVLVKAAIKKLIAVAPLFGLPVLNPLTVYLVGKLFEVIYDEVAMIIALTKIDIDVQHEKEAYEKAAEELKKKLETQDEESIQKAKEEFKRRLGDLIRFPVP